MAYKRGNAGLYASFYWNKVCDDGYIATSNPAYVSAPAGADIEALNTPGEDDCTHFVSRCIGQLGGGLHIPSPVGMAKGILSAPDLVRLLLDKGLATSIVEKVSKAEAARYTSSLKLGDVIAYFRLNDIRPKNSDYGHCVLHLTDGRVACHTISRWGTMFSEVGFNSDLVTFLHIPD